MKLYHEEGKRRDDPKIEEQVNLVPNKDHKNVCGCVVWRQEEGRRNAFINRRYYRSPEQWEGACFLRAKH